MNKVYNCITRSEFKAVWYELKWVGIKISLFGRIFEQYRTVGYEPKKVKKPDNVEFITDWG